MRKPFTVDRRTGHQQYIHSDFDKDGTPNIDDRRPFNKNVSKRVASTSLSETIKSIEKNREKAKRIGRRYKKQGFTYRVKDTFAIINKWGLTHRTNNKKAPYVTGDILGIRQTHTLRSQARESWNAFKTENKRIIYENRDYYRNPHGKGTLYRGFHSNFFITGTPAEAQFKTQYMQALHEDPEGNKIRKKYTSKSPEYNQYMLRKKPLYMKGLKMGF